MLDTIWKFFPEAIFYLSDIIAIISIIAILTVIFTSKGGKEGFFLSLGTLLVYAHPHILYKYLTNHYALAPWHAAIIAIIAWVGCLYIQGKSLKGDGHAETE